MSNSILKPFVLWMIVIMVAPVSGQQVHSYKIVPRTIYEKRPVKVTKWVEETVMETQSVTSYKQVWQTETRNRYKTEYKPIRKTSEREERTVVRKPVVETRYRKKETRNTTYETVTELRDEQYTVRKPIIETEMREERVTVRKPITEQLIEVQRTTSFKPVWKNSTALVPQETVVTELNAVPDPNQRPRMQWLQSGNYTDPVTGQTVYRRRGFHWVQPSTVVAAAASTIPTLVPQETSELSYIPEVIETRKPVDVTRYVEETETRRVPVETQRFIETVETRKVPVTVSVPKTTITVEEIPYTETTYVDEVVVKKVPYTETTYEKVETVEPYTVEVASWVPETKEVKVPRTVRKPVDYEVIRDIPRTVLFRIPLDDCGNELGTGVQIDADAESFPSASSDFSSATGTTTSLRVPPSENAKSVLNTEEKEPASDESTEAGYKGELNPVQPEKSEETTVQKPSIVVPETTPGSSTSELEPIPKSEQAAEEAGVTNSVEGVQPASKPEVNPSSTTGNEQAADRSPVPNESKTETPAENPQDGEQKPPSGDADDSQSDDAVSGNSRSSTTA